MVWGPAVQTSERSVPFREIGRPPASQKGGISKHDHSRSQSVYGDETNQSRDSDVSPWITSVLFLGFLASFSKL